MQRTFIKVLQIFINLLECSRKFERKDIDKMSKNLFSKNEDGGVGKEAAKRAGADAVVLSFFKKHPVAEILSRSIKIGTG